MMRNRLSSFRIILFLLSLSGVISGLQAQKHTVSGRVLEHTSLQGIANVNISVFGTRQGCTTNDTGEFTLQTDELPANLIVSHLSYETRRIWIEEESSQFIILLDPVSRMLREVEVTSENGPVAFYKDDRYSVLDYEVFDDLVFLLVYRFNLKNSELLCKTVFGDTVARSATLNFKPASLFLDCLGCLHILSSDSAYQVFLHKDSLILAYANGLQKFNSTLADCVASTEDRLFFREESRDHLTVNFYCIERKTSRKYFIASARDEEMQKVLANNPMDYYYLLMDRIPDGNENLVEWVWVKKIMYQPNTSILKKLGQTLILINVADSTMGLYNLDGKCLQDHSIRLVSPVKGQWTREIYIDDLARSIYTSFRKNGRTVVCRIDPTSGELSQVLKTSHTFPEKLRVQHDQLFYLYDVPGEGDTKKLFRQKL